MQRLTLQGFKFRVADWDATPESVKAVVTVLSERLAYIEEQLNQNSQNSSRPPRENLDIVQVFSRGWLSSLSIIISANSYFLCNNAQFLQHIVDGTGCQPNWISFGGWVGRACLTHPIIFSNFG